MLRINEMFTKLMIPVKHFYKYFEKLFYSLSRLSTRDGQENLIQFNFICMALIFILVCIIIYLLAKKLCSKKKKQSKLGKRPIEEIKYLKDIIEEIHYAACYCGKNRKLIERCIKLLQIYPEACNFPMYGHKYTPFLRACWNGCTELIAYMLSIGADIEATTDAGEGGVYLATYRILKNKDNNFDALELLLEAGVDINQARHDGYTALHLAGARGHGRLAGWLLARGADPRASARAASPHHLALVYGHKKTAALLKYSD